MSIKDVFGLFCDCWRLYRKYILRDLNDTNIDEYIVESGKIAKEYKNDPFARDMIVSVTNEIERRIR